MASRTARRSRGKPPAATSSSVPLRAVAAHGAGAADGLDDLLHHRIRLGIVSALAGTESLSFVDLRALLETTDGNLSVHARRLEDAHYITCSKSFADRRPRTEYRLAPQGRRALERYLDHMQSLIAATRATLGR